MRENDGNATECFGSQMSKHSAFVLLECHLMLLLLEDNVLPSHFHASRAGISCLHYGMFQAHQIQKFQSSFWLLLSEVQRARAWFVFFLVAFSTIAGNSRGKGYGWNGNGEGTSLTWTWIQTESRVILAEDSGKICQILCCATVTLTQKRKKKENELIVGEKRQGEKGEKCSYTLNIFESKSWC